MVFSIFDNVKHDCVYYSHIHVPSSNLSTKWFLFRLIHTGFDELWVSTDDKEIAEEALRVEANVHQRPASAAEDNTSSILAVREFVDRHPGEINPYL